MLVSKSNSIHQYQIFDFVSYIANITQRQANILNVDLLTYDIYFSDYFSVLEVRVSAPE
jgi:hypothetical protein